MIASCNYTYAIWCPFMLIVFFEGFIALPYKWKHGIIDCPRSVGVTVYRATCKTSIAGDHSRKQAIRHIYAWVWIPLVQYLCERIFSENGRKEITYGTFQWNWLNAYFQGSSFARSQARHYKSSALDTDQYNVGFTFLFILHFQGLSAASFFRHH